VQVNPHHDQQQHRDADPAHVCCHPERAPKQVTEKYPKQMADGK